MATKNRKGYIWWVGGIVIVAIVSMTLLSGGGTGIDYTQYDYMDSQIDKPDATHTIEVYSDFQCPYCGVVAPLLRAVELDFDVRVEYKQFPISSHTNSDVLAEASECARDQGRFWAYHDILFQHQDALTKPDLIDHAEGLGMDLGRFKDCVNNREKQALVSEHKLEGQRLGVTGTPSIYLDGEKVSYRTYEQFEAALG